MAWLHDITRALEVSGAATLVGFVASLVGIAGVPLAIWNAWRARRAAEAARAAAREATDKLSRFSGIASLSTVIEQIEGLKDLHRRGSWSLAVARYSPIRRALIELRTTGALATPDHLQTVQATISRLGKLERVVDKALANAETEPDLSRLNQQLSTSLDNLQAVLLQLQRADLDGTNGRH